MVPKSPDDEFKQVIFLNNKITLTIKFADSQYLSMYVFPSSLLSLALIEIIIFVEHMYT